jgi:AcrR family transcriptional regulator
MAEELTRVQRRQKETRSKIFRTAMDLFQRKGFENTTIAEISEAADIGKGTFFTYFPTKEAIFGYLGEMLVETMAAALHEGLQHGQPVSQILRIIFQTAAGWHEANHDLTLQVTLAGLRANFVVEVDQDNQVRFVQLLYEAIHAGQARGELSQAALADDVALALVGGYFAVVLSWSHNNQRREPDGRPLAERLQAGLDLVLDGLRK